MNSEDNDADHKSGKAEPAVSDSPVPPRPDLIDQQDSLISLGESEQDDAEKQFRSTCEKIREIEERARHTVKPQGVEHRCSFCNRSRTEAGALCQADQIDICICQQCAEAALALLQQQSD